MKSNHEPFMNLRNSLKGFLLFITVSKLMKTEGRLDIINGLQTTL